MKEIWSHNAKLLEARFTIEELVSLCGTLFEWDHIRPMPPQEYEFWKLNCLPFGWAIISPPPKK